MARGVLYRADDPVRLSATGRARIAALGLRAVIDLRQQAQVDRGHLFVPAEITHHIPMVDRVIDVDDPPAQFTDAADLVDLYEDMVERGSRQVVRALDVVAEHAAAGPVMVHCVAGKDRTGLLVAAVQAAIGVTSDSIVEEYALSDQPTRDRRTAMLATPLEGDPPVGRSPELIWTAPAQTMAMLLERVVERHGSLAAWLAELGVSDATIGRLRQHLLTDRNDGTS